MAFQLTTSTRKLAALKRRLRLAAGGTSAGKTVSILQLLIDDAQTDKTPTLTSVVSESFPHLRRGAMRDFLNILQEHGYFNDARWNKGDSTYTFESGSKIEFFSADQASKVRGPRRDRLFVNEVNNVSKESWEQLLIRTREYAFADWNPVSDFYMYEDYGLNDEPAATVRDEDTDFVILTYKDNEALEPSIVKEIEKRRTNGAWFRPYGEGKRGEMQGRIFTGWNIIDEIPHEARLEVRGLDFGFARDPNALCDIYYYNGGYIIDELAYRVGMLHRQLADLILNQPDPNVLTIADNSDQAGIAELREYGVNIIPVIKKGREGKTFTNTAIGWVQEQRVSVTKRSTNFIKSYRNFMWQTDPEGNVIPKYDHFLSDGMMSVVYGMQNFAPRQEEEDDLTTTGNLAALWG
jgi:phage terminase large subunit